MSKIARRVDDQVGERIRERRTQMGLTQDHLAKALGMSYQQIQKYETGANRVSAGRLYEIAQKLQVEVAYFFVDIDPGAILTPMEHGGKNRATIELVRNFALIKDAGMRAHVAGLIKSLAKDSKKSSKAA